MDYTTLYGNIQRFYDASSGVWEATWGEHMHHGYYGADGTAVKDHYQAQIDLIEVLLRWGGVSGARRILDLGCGIGGSSLYLAGKFDAEVVGITLSPVQARRARARAAAVGLADRVRFQVADALAPPYAAGGFDLVWSMESGEHMPDKRQFLRAAVQQMAPGGTFLMATWCHRPTPPVLTAAELRFLDRLYAVYHLPYIISNAQYARIAAEVGLTNVATADWTQAVAPFWGAVVRSALRPAGARGLLQAGWPTIRGAFAMNFMIRGYRSGLIRFGVLRGGRP